MQNFSEQKSYTTASLKKPLFAALLVAGAVHIGMAQAATLPNGTVLNINHGTTTATGSTVTGGSWFGMDQDGNSKIGIPEKKPINYAYQVGAGCITGVIASSGIPIGSAITATGSHGGCIDGTESPAFDKWEFFGATGMDYLRTAATDIGDGTASGDANSRLLNFDGWTVTWNGVPAIYMNAAAWQPGNCSVLGCTGWTFMTGQARLQWNGTDGGAYILDYTATVPASPPTGFENVKYYVHLEGTVTLPPFTLTDDAAATTPGTPVTINVTANDNPTGYTIDASSVAIVTNGTIGTAVANSDNTVTYTPTSTGTDTFTYRVTGNGGITSSTATVTVTVNAVLPPTANADSAIATGTTTASISVLSNDTAGTNAISASTVAISTAASHGTATPNPDGTVSYTATAGFSGTDTFRYTVQDTVGTTSNAATVSVAVRATTPASSSGTFAPGLTAVANSSTTGGGLTSSQVGIDSALSQQCVGGCFDFSVSGLANGASVKVVLPLSAPIPANAVYRKSINGTWQDFSTSAGNAVASAAAISAGVCPQAGSASYTAGLTAGNECVQLTLVDGGADDADSLANGTILDPSGIGVKGATTSDLTSATSGCSISSSRVNLSDRGDWLLLLGFISWLGLVIRRRQTRA